VSTTVTKPTTADELIAMPDDGYRYELVEGELTRMALAGAEHGRITVNITGPLFVHVRTHSLGTVYAAETGFKLQSNPDTVRAPDVAFVSKSRVNEAGPPSGYWSGAPDLAVEVMSPGDSREKADQKARHWLRAGTRLVWVIDPRRHILTVYTSPEKVKVLTETDTLDGGDVISGFQIAVMDIFNDK
jgi:Uma2 family endonuclease